MSRHLYIAIPLAMAASAALPATASAQNIGYGDFTASGGEPQANSDENRPRRSRGRPAENQRKAEFEPYIEVGQVVTKDISPGDDLLTYSRVGAGADGAVVGQRHAGSFSVRYQRDFNLTRRGDRERASALVDGYATVAPGVQINAGGYADSLYIGDDGTASPATPSQLDRATQVYSVFAGPSVSAVAGDVALNANYRIGYTKVESPDTFVFGPDEDPVDLFEDSVSHQASVTAGVEPGTTLPVGVSVGGNYYREDVSNLDQRIEDARAQLTVTMPVSRTVSVSGAVGYEKVEISARDAVRDETGRPVRGTDGRYVTDKVSPRIIAYDVDGLTWDAGVMWRPSNKTSLAAHVGRRYGGTGVYGQFYYTPNSRTSINVLVYDNLAGFGGQLNQAIELLPEDFLALRNPITGELSGCVSSLGEGSCIDGALSSLRSSSFRARGVSASYGYRTEQLRFGLAAGYDRRKFIGAPGTVLETVDGTVDESFWMNGQFAYQLDRNSGISYIAYAKWLKPEESLLGDVTIVGANAAYHRRLTDHLSATAAFGIDGFEREFLVEDIWSASALVGMRYRF